MTTMAVLAETVDRWRRIADARVADRSLKPDCCILASKVLLVALTEAGFEAYAEPTYAVASNAAAWPLIGARIPASEWPPEAWSVGIEPGRIEVGSYPGHLVVLCWVDDQLMLVDGASRQFSRPAKNMTIPPVLMFPVPDWPEPTWARTSKWAMSYQPAPLGQLHRVGNDWTKNWRDYIEEMRQVPA